jgi:predicted O-methyltransferase YrrM
VAAGGASWWLIISDSLQYSRSMNKLFGRIGSNLRFRLRLLRIALWQRYIWPDVMAMAHEHDSMYHDVAGNLEPLGFARAVFGKNGAMVPEPPDFSRKLGSPNSFTPPGAPDSANSEACVGLFLAQLIFYKKPAVVVEIGCLGGWTSAHLALALQSNGHGKLYCVDCEQLHLDVTLANLKRQGLDGVAKTLLGNSLDPAVVAALPKAIDVLFLDASHRYPETLDEIKLYSSRLAEGGCLVMHDSISHDGVRRSIAEVSGKFRILTFATEDGDGVSVLLKAGSPAAA